MQVLANGLISGLAIAALAFGFTLVYLPTRVFHIALAGIYAAAPFVAWQGLRWGWGGAASALCAVLAGSGLSVLCEFANHARLERKGAPGGVHLISSLGIYILLVQTVALAWGNDPKALRPGADETWRFGTVILTHGQILCGTVAALVVLAGYAWLRLTRLGLQFRALADNPIEAALRGLNVRWLRLLSFALSGAVVSIGSLLVAYDLGFDPHTGLQAILLAVVAMIVGGHPSFAGPILGGILLGVLRAEVVWYWSAQWQDAVTFLVLAGFLLLRPCGLVGQRVRLEAQP